VTRCEAIAARSDTYAVSHPQRLESPQNAKFVLFEFVLLNIPNELLNCVLIICVVILVATYQICTLATILAVLAEFNAIDLFKVYPGFTHLYPHGAIPFDASIISNAVSPQECPSLEMGFPIY
jgi:hypothetical protein